MKKNNDNKNKDIFYDGVYYYVYVLKSEKDSNNYVGYTNDYSSLFKKSVYECFTFCFVNETLPFIV